jgi:hypothetical protein
MSTERPKEASPPRVRTGQGSTQLDKDEFARRLRERFYDPAFDHVAAEIERVIDVAWDGYERYRKGPRARRAGPGFADPSHELPIEWLETRDRIPEAQAHHDDPQVPGGGRPRMAC